LSSKLGLADNPALRNALRTDEQRIEALLIRIFDSKFAEDYVLCLKGDPAQNFLDAVQAVGVHPIPARSIIDAVF
jgi:hypothetical protein